MIKDILKRIRKENGYKQDQIAKILGVTKSCYSNYEQGIREPSIEIIKKLCVLFDISADELLEIDSNEQRKNVIINSFNNNSGKIDFKG